MLNFNFIARVFCKDTNNYLGAQTVNVKAYTSQEAMRETRKHFARENQYIRIQNIGEAGEILRKN